MKLYLKNIGMLEEAEVTLKPLSVIAGENDNGKSTVGKIVFCILKAINRYKEDLSENKEYWATEKLEEIYFLVRGALANPSDIRDVTFMLRLPVVATLSESRWEAIEKRLDKSLVSLVSDGKVLDDVAQLRKEINEIFEQPEDTQKAIENAFNKVFVAEFDASLLLHGATEGRIKLTENNIELLHLKISEGNVVELLSDVEPIELQDATFIDSPLILNHYDLLIRSQTMLEASKRTTSRLGIPYTTLHTKDLFDKLIEPVSPEETSADKRELLDKIKKITHGEISHDDGERDFVFKRDGHSISIKNTASGIKAFGIFQILLANGFVSKNTMVVFDEPENHLHPKWQLKLAELLVTLAQHKISVLVSSHSPYMIEALKRYAELADLDDQTAFYLAEERRIENKDRLSDIFAVLAEPFEIFRQMDAEILKGE